MGSHMPTMNVSLPNNLSEFVEDELATGDYSSASEVVRDALRLLKREKALEQERQEILRREVTIGWNQAKNGQLSNRTVGQIAADVAKDDDA
jgi:antitoxin ParD1/3/4